MSDGPDWLEHDGPDHHTIAKIDRFEAGDYTDPIRAELRGLAKQLDDLAHRLARIEDHFRLNGRL